MAFSSDGKLLVSGSDDNTVRLWDPMTGTCRAILEGHSDLVRAVAFSPDGELLASGSDDNTVRVWDRTTGTCRATLKGHSKRIGAVAFSPDGKLLVSGSYDKTVRLWDPTGTCRATLESHSSVTAVAFSPDGKLLQLKSIVWFYSIDDRDVIQIVNPRDAEFQPRTSSLVILSASQDWIFLGKQKLFSLTPDYWVDCFAVHNDIIALVHPTGRISFIRFDLESVPMGELFKSELTTIRI